MAQTTQKFTILRRPEDGMFFKGARSRDAKNKNFKGLGFDIEYTDDPLDAARGEYREEYPEEINATLAEIAKLVEAEPVVLEITVNVKTQDGEEVEPVDYEKARNRRQDAAWLVDAMREVFGEE